MRTVRGAFWLILAVWMWTVPAWATTTVLQNAATTNVTGSNISVGDKGAVGLTVSISGTATLTFQGSADGGVTWSSMNCTALGSIVQVTSTTSSNQYQCAVGGLTHVQSPISGCAGCTVTVNVNASLANGLGGGGVSGENPGSGQSSAWIAVRPLVHATYSASNTWTPPATPSDLLTITGSASKTIRVLSVKVTTTNTAAGSQQFSMIKRSTVDTGGTPIAGPVVPYDSASAAGTATVNHYTANPAALGTAVGTINTLRVSSPAPVPAAFVTNQDAGFELLPMVNSGGIMTTQPVILRGIAEQLAVNFGGAALVAGQTHAYVIVWTESVAPSE